LIDQSLTELFITDQILPTFFQFFRSPKCAPRLFSTSAKLSVSVAKSIELVVQLNELPSFWFQP